MARKMWHYCPNVAFPGGKRGKFFHYYQYKSYISKAFSLWPIQANTSCEYDSVILTLKSMIEDIGFITYSLEIKTEV